MNYLLSDVNDLILRLEWGQPAFTIIDVRDRTTFHNVHITGSISIPLNELAERAKISLHKERQIYVYGEHENDATQASQILKGIGFKNVSTISGGLSAWKEIGGATEGVLS